MWFCHTRPGLDRSPFAKGDHSGVDIIAKRAVEYMPPNESSDTRLPAITTEKRAVRSPWLGTDAAWTRIRDWDGGVCPMTIGRFKAHFGSRISARRRASPPAPATALPRPITIAPATHSRRTAFAVPPRLTTS